MRPTGTEEQQLDCSDDGLIAAANLLAAQMRDATRPGICPKCLYLFARTIWEKSHEATVVHILIHKHDFWTSCTSLASSPIISGDITRIRILLDNNLLSCGQKHLHARASQSLGDSVLCTMDALFQCLYAALSRGPQKKYTNILVSKKGMWPTDLSDLMPRGANPYVAWASVIPTHSALAFISRLAVVARQEIMSDLIGSPARDVLIELFVRVLYRWHRPDYEFPLTLRTAQESGVQLVSPTRAESSATLREVVYMIIVIQEGPGRLLDDLTNIAIGYESQLHDAIIDLVDRPDFTDIAKKNRLIATASMLASQGHLPKHRLVEDLDHSPGMLHIAENGADVTDAIHLYLRLRQDHRKCHNESCNRYSREDDGGVRSLAICSRCKSARYCGTICQLVHWTKGSQGVPHKVVCSALGKFQDAQALVNGSDKQHFVQMLSDKAIISKSEFIGLANMALRDKIIPLNIRLSIYLRVREAPDQQRSLPSHAQQSAGLFSDANDTVEEVAIADDYSTRIH
ncbi:hypothetical protein AURDEDRAFT_131450 [Auricularia subglabra TFB-10046 SS5]|uniref:MYND-type domain-containing protein n=1 Tax=Auricularia subglabra (strain TFB-10046 / SS5) TaxID=717982 RepID=J0WPT4_AURST|nr:hypothetical protein AURDEDRAFT_131450 [Auricularia subglabra TFB-10046 SS5]